MTINLLQPDVFRSRPPFNRLRRGDIELVSANAASSPKRRSRICAHASTEDSLHEMLIAISHGSYIRPHRHRGKPESFHVIEGEADVVVFADDGRIVNVCRMGDISSGLPFFQRITTPVYHTVVVRSAIFVVHEVTLGPFVPSATQFSVWSPGDDDELAVRAFMRGLDERIAAGESAGS